MQRREFVRNAVAAAAGLAATGTVHAAGDNTASTGKPFNLNYAPHAGMFKNHAGDNFIDQIRFMHDQGFRAIEDNGLLGRPVEEQKKIGEELAKLGMTMGVFVVDGGENWKTSLTTGKKEHLDVFLSACRKSVEAAKRVNAKWMTVVPGFFERNLPIGIQTANVGYRPEEQSVSSYGRRTAKFTFASTTLTP